MGNTKLTGSSKTSAEPQLSYGEALKIVGGLSAPSKMPWWSWSISANDCITGQKLAKQEGTVCSSCYALKGNYVFTNVKSAHARRRAGYDDPRFIDAFTVVLRNLYDKTRKVRSDGSRENRFRWFDAGDLQSVEMLKAINTIARNTPMIQHWLPTREMKILRDFQASGEKLADNLQVRVSIAKIGATPKAQPLGFPYATVGCAEGPLGVVHHCQASSLQGNRCLDCDLCWRAGNVNYPLH
jgi:hypothetical protein